MKRNWFLAWMIQIAEMLAVCFAQAASYPVSRTLYEALLWALVPLAGMFTACRAVQRGLLNYAAWIAPPACLYAAHYLLWGFAPSAGAGLLTALVSLVGAAAGEVIIQRKKNR